MEFRSDSPIFASDGRTPAQIRAIGVRLAPAPHAPFLDRRRDRPPGLAPLDPDAWIEIDAAYAAQMALRDRILADEGAAAAAAETEAGPATAELFAMLASHLSRRHPTLFAQTADGAVRRPDGVVVAPPGPIDALGRLVQEDWMLLSDPGRSPGASPPRLIAAALCFPSRWALSQKIGRTLDAIHAPVPGYAERLAARTARIFAALAVERPLIRWNTSVVDSDALRLETRETAPPPAPAAPLCLRVERQTLRRLPQTRAIAFGVKTCLTAIADLTPAQAAGLAAKLASLPPEEVAYKGGSALIAAARAAADARARA